MNLNEVQAKGFYCTAAGTDTITLSKSNVPDTLGYTAGLTVVWKAAGANTTGVTLNLNTLGVKTLKLRDGSAVPASYLVSGAVYSAVYDGTDFLLLDDPRATAAQAASGTSSTLALTPASVAKTTTSGIRERAIGGLYEKWGSLEVQARDSGTAGEVAVTFPTAFPSSCLGVVITLIQTQANDTGNYVGYAKNLTSTGVTIGIDASAPSTPTFTVSWYAWGE